MDHIQIVSNDDFPHVTDRQFLDMLATDVETHDVVPAEALMGAIRRMPELATVQFVPLPSYVWCGDFREPIEAPDHDFFGAQDGIPVRGRDGVHAGAVAMASPQAP